MTNEDTTKTPADQAREPQADGQLTEERIRETLKNVVDPEIGLDIISLGLVYGVTIDDGNVNIRMTLTTPACPVGPMFISGVEAAVTALPGVKSAKVDLTFDPPWDPRTMASDEAKMMMGFYY
jgi:metal-sulfur cluster biosynthetic enzyme